MSLPKLPPPTDTVEIDGAFIEIRGLTRAEAARCQKMVESHVPWADLEIACIAYATDTERSEVAEWYEKTAGPAVETLLDRIKALSGLDEGAPKSSAETDRSGGG